MELQSNDIITPLLETYSAVQIPKNGSMPLQVSILVSVSNVMNVDILQYTICTILLLNQTWYDERLKWDKAQYPHHFLTVPSENIWTPSFSIREAHSLEYKDPSPKVKLFSNGWVQYILAMRVDFNCNFELFRYPEDDTDCTVTFHSLLDGVHLFLSILILLLISMIETVIVTRIASEDLPGWMSWRPWAHSTSDTSQQDSGNHGKAYGPEEVKVIKPQSPTEVGGQRSPSEIGVQRQARAATIDRRFSVLYTGFMLLFYGGFGIIFSFMECRTEARPRPRSGF